MAEGPNTKIVYETRSRKRSRECFNSSENLVSSATNDTVEENVIIDLTQEDEKAKTSPVEGNLGKPDCAICLQTCIHPTRLPCGHIFCFLCVKGAAHGNKKCAMCRTPIPHNYFNNPDLLETPDELAKKPHEGQEWFYEGRHGGWWQYEERMSKEIEEHYKNGVDKFQTLICGSMYTIDFSTNTQYKTDAPWQMRRIVRDKPSNINKRGIAGIQ